MEKEEKQEVVALISGAVAIGVVKGIDEGIFNSNPTKYSGKFPYMGTVSILPPLDDWLILAIPAAVTIAGIATKKPTLKYFGLGGLLFQGANMLRIIAIRAINHAAYGFGTRSLTQAVVPIIKEI
jgi:hypothetical protein